MSGGDLVFTHGLARLLATSPDDQVRNGKRAMELVQQMLQRGRTLELGETYAMTLAELGQYREAQSLAARSHRRGGSCRPRRHEGATDRTAEALRQGGSVPHAMD